MENTYKKCKVIFKALIQDQESKAFFGPMQDMADYALKHDDHAYLRRLLKELLLISREFPDRVTPAVLQQIGEPEVDIRLQIAEIIKNGVISNSDELGLVNEFIDLVHQNPEMSPVVERLGSLILKFESGLK